MTPAPLSPRSEPLLWVQLLSLAVLPLEALLLLLVLAGSDPGPLAPLERILGWGMGSLAPALVLWWRPADSWSLLMVRTPPKGRRDLQRRLSALQPGPRPQAVCLALGSLLSLILLWWADCHGAVATGFSPTQESPRLIALLLASALLALIQWQWQQGLQSLWLLGRTSQQLQEAEPLSAVNLESVRFSPGLSLLLPAPLDWRRSTAAAVPDSRPREPDQAARSTASSDATAAAIDRGEKTAHDASSPEPARPAVRPTEPLSAPESESGGIQAPDPSSAPAGTVSVPERVPDSSGGTIPVPVEPQQTGADHNREQLDQQVS